MNKVISNIRNWLDELRDTFNPPESIRLAVVGSISSGKSFLIRDLLNAILGMDCTCFRSKTLERKYGFKYRSPKDFSPNENGGNGGTPIYACRQSKHFGCRVAKTSSFRYVLSFLNIPGEIFEEPKLTHYHQLKKQLLTDRKLFTVHTYDISGERRLIVKPNEDFCVVDNTIAPPKELSAYVDRFKSWAEINGELEPNEKFKAKKVEHLSGNELMMNFFKYDTDSVMRSITSLIEKGDVFHDLSFNADDFENNKSDLSFVFFHYCTLATDIILCDRIYAPRDRDQVENIEQMDYKTLTNSLYQFLEEENLAKEIKVYLAFRNVDFLLQKPEVEAAYQSLYKQLRKKKMDKGGCRNAIYSLFSYLLFNHIGSINNSDIGDTIEYILGIDETMNVELLPGEANSTEESFIKKLEDRYVDITGSTGQLMSPVGMTDHILSRIGDQGQGFRQLLVQTGWAGDPNSSFVPHVFFTCTPITQDYRVFKNGDRNKGQDEFGFYREITLDNGTTVVKDFDQASSCACFGSYQLLLDILYRHDIGSFSYGGLLELTFNVQH